jgi:hypothetical protein
MNCITADPAPHSIGLRPAERMMSSDLADFTGSVNRFKSMFIAQCNAHSIGKKLNGTLIDRPLRMRGKLHPIVVNRGINRNDTDHPCFLFQSRCATRVECIKWQQIGSKSHGKHLLMLVPPARSSTV